MNESSLYGEITSIQKDGSKCYLIMESCDLPQLPYQINMIRYNNIKEILPIQFLIEDGKYRYYYDISGKVPLQTFMNQKKYTYKEIRTIMSDLYRCVQQLDEYLLSQDALILDPEYMYTDPEEMRISFCFYPDKKTDFQKELVSLFDFFINHINYQDEDTVVLAYGLYQKSREENAALREVMEQFITKGGSRGSRSGQGVQKDGLRLDGNQREGNQGEGNQREGRYETDASSQDTFASADWDTGSAGEDSQDAAYGSKQGYYKGETASESRIRSRFSREANHSRELFPSKKSGRQDSRKDKKGKINRQERQNPWNKQNKQNRQDKQSGQNKQDRQNKQNKQDQYDRPHKNFICYIPDIAGFVIIAFILRYMYLHRGVISIRLTALLLFGIAAVTGICLAISSYLEDRMMPQGQENADAEETFYNDYNGYQVQKEHMERTSYADAPRSGEEGDPEDPNNRYNRQSQLNQEEDVGEELMFTAPDYTDNSELQNNQLQNPVPNPVNPIPKTVVLDREDMFWMHYPALISTEKDKRPDIMLKNRSNIIGKVREAVDVCIDGQGISRIHAKLAFSDGNCFLTDLGSTNGTYVNGSRIEQGERHQLEEGDEVRFADAGYVYKPA